MDFLKEYQQKKTTAEKAVQMVENGQWIDFGFGTNQPIALDKALAKRFIEEPELENIHFRGGLALWRPEVCNIPNASERISWNSWHTSGIERKMIDEGLCFYNILRYSEMPRYYLDHIQHVDINMIQVSPMDKHGYFYFGLTNSHMQAVCQVSKHVIVEVNENMPVIAGGFGEKIHISDVSMIVEGDNPPIATLGSATPKDVDIAVAKLIVPQLKNGDCLQLGIGAMANSIGNMIAESDLKDLGIHSEMYVDSFIDMVEAGRITGKYKNIDRGREVFTFAAGSQRMYDYMHQNLSVMSAPVDYVNSVEVMSSIDNFVSINNAIEIDLFGQVVSESVGTRHISGAGGALDFVLGAYLSKGGRSFICFSSTLTGKDGQLKSRIRPTITPGGIITATRANVHYVATEYGIACLKGTSTWQRAERLIELAHPNFREELIQEAEKLHIWRASNKR